MASTSRQSRKNKDKTTKDKEAKDEPSIRLVPYVEFSTSRPPLHFDPIQRTSSYNTIIKIGRFTDKQSSERRGCIAFKSKVVSRSHAEIWCRENKEWFIRDVKSSSGTFLNSIRLSAPGFESQPVQVKDGDILQLGVDFRGGTEEVYRSVKIRIGLNNSWTKLSESYSNEIHKNLHSQNNHECCICLCPILPNQALFYAPCSHCWHFKCIRPYIMNNYPMFDCPLCRRYHYLEQNVDEEIKTEELTNTESNLAAQMEGISLRQEEENFSSSTSNAEEIVNEEIDIPNGATNATNSTTEATNGTRMSLGDLPRNTIIKEDATTEYLTPRNNTGPFIFANAAAAGAISGQASTSRS